MLIAILLQAAPVVVMPTDRQSYLETAISRCEDDPKARMASIAEVPRKDRAVVEMLCAAFDKGAMYQQLADATEKLNCLADRVRDAADAKIQEMKD